ncbi:MAG: hypothetical protein JNM76_03895 [Betaproteobacteria bacterium]|nr:hypothetical protein [Betaproteobacteria bacterium]
MLSTVEGWAQCCCVPDSIFEIAQNLKAERSTDSDSELEITGVFAETMQNSGEQFPLRGRAYYQCGGHAFIELELPTSFLLPAATRTVVHVVLPEKLTITDSNYSRKQYFLPELEGKKPSLETIENGKIAFFQDWTFLFTTSEEDEFAIVHSYSARAKKGIGSNLKSESTREAP